MIKERQLSWSNSNPLSFLLSQLKSIVILSLSLLRADHHRGEVAFKQVGILVVVIVFLFLFIIIISDNHCSVFLSL